MAGEAGGESPILGAIAERTERSGGMHKRPLVAKRGSMGIPALEPERSGGSP